MPNANWSNPTLTSTYTNFVSEVKNRDEDLALQFDGTTSTNLPTNTIRWDSAANRWKKWNGSSWAELTSTYALTALSTTGNANIGGTLGVTGAATLSSTLGVTGAITGSSTVSGTALIPTAATVPTNGVYLPAANTVALATNGTGRLFVDASGNVGVGTTSTAGFGRGVSVNGTTYSYYDLYADGVIYGRVRAFSNEMALLSQGASSYLTLGTNNTERMRLDSSGRLGLGTSSPAAGIHIATAGQTTSALDTAGSLNLLVTDTGASAGNGGSIVFGFNSGSGRFAAIKGQVITGAGNSTGHLTFATRNATGDSALTERLRITNDGLVGIGTTSPSQQFEVSGGYSLLNGLRISGADTANTIYQNAAVGISSGNHITFATNAAGPFERARIDNSGRLLVGTSTADTSGNALLQVNGSIKGTITSGTAVASTSGTAIDFTGIPSWVQRVTVMFRGVSTNGTSIPLVQLGTSGGFTISGYLAASTSSTPSSANYTTGFGLGSNAAANVIHGIMMIGALGANSWAASGTIGASNAAGGWYFGGSIALSGTLDRVRITTVNGTATFDAGTINILYEG
jgi:hypothetical protein